MAHEGGSLGGESGGKSSFRVNLQTVNVERADHSAEDDFKTWAHAFVITRQRPNNRFWYTADNEINLGKTSVRWPTRIRVV